MKFPPPFVQFFFKQAGDNEAKFRCNKCFQYGGKDTYIKQEPGTGWTNCKSHLTRCVGSGYMDQFHQSMSELGVDIKEIEKMAGELPKELLNNSFYLSNKREMQAFQWIKWLAL